MLIRYATYGKGTPCTVFTFNGWYVVKGSKNINFCTDMIDVNENDFTWDKPLNVEVLADTDMITSSEPVSTLYHLLTLVCE